jgi:hypothetical protein
MIENTIKLLKDLHLFKTSIPNGCIIGIEEVGIE